VILTFYTLKEITVTSCELTEFE